MVEMIVVVAFTAVIIGAACTVLYYGTQTFHSGTTNAFSQQKTTLAESYIQQYAVAATDFASSVDGGADGVIFSASGNVLHVKTQKISGGASSEVTVDGISEIDFKMENGSLNYTIFAADDSYRLTGGIVPSSASSAVSLTSCRVMQGGAVLFMETPKADPEMP
jgi:hypothetical protein